LGRHDVQESISFFYVLKTDWRPVRDQERKVFTRFEILFGILLGFLVFDEYFCKGILVMEKRYDQVRSLQEAEDKNDQ
jgi:hypothetical protein